MRTQVNDQGTEEHQDEAKRDGDLGVDGEE
jgi:hypothetical protein